VQVWNRGTGILQWYRVRSRTMVQVYRSTMCIHGYSSTTELHVGRSSVGEKWYNCSTGVQWVQDK